MRRRWRRCSPRRGADPAHSALPRRAPLTTGSADPMHHVWHRLHARSRAGKRVSLAAPPWPPHAGLPHAHAPQHTHQAQLNAADLARWTQHAPWYGTKRGHGGEVSHTLRRTQCTPTPRTSCSHSVHTVLVSHAPCVCGPGVSQPTRVCALVRGAAARRAAGRRRADYLKAFNYMYLDYLTTTTTCT